MKICTRPLEPINNPDIPCSDCKHDPRLHMNVKGGCLACQWQAFIAPKLSSPPQPDDGFVDALGAAKLGGLIDEVLTLASGGSFVSRPERERWEAEMTNKLCDIFDFGKEVGSEAQR